MADKISTIILKVDLECRRCYEKMSKTICKLRERENIQTITFEEKNNTVTISGSFDPKKLSKKLCSKACNVIKDMQIQESKGKEKEREKTKDAKPAGSTEPNEDKPKETKPTESTKALKEKPNDKLKDSEPVTDKLHALELNPPRPEPVYIGQGPELGNQPIWSGSGCGCRPEGYYGDYRCCWYCRGYGWATEGQPVVVYGAPAYGGYKSCDFFYEDDPQSSCSIQ